MESKQLLLNFGYNLLRTFCIADLEKRFEICNLRKLLLLTMLVLRLVKEKKRKAS